MSEEKLQIAISLCSEEAKNISIGIQNEKILHKIMKYYLSTNPYNHEIKIGKIYADVVVDGKIYEIQTASFNALRKKLDFLLPSYQVTIVYPVSHKKIIYNLSEEGELLSEKKSPKVKTPFEILIELYKIKSYLNNPNLSFKVVYLDMDEYRTIVPKRRMRSKGYVRLKQIPTRFINEYNLKNALSYLSLMKEYDLPTEFTTKEFSKCFRISIQKAACCIQVLNTLQVLNLIGKRGRRNLWQQKNI